MFDKDIWGVVGVQVHPKGVQWGRNERSEVRAFGRSFSTPTFVHRGFVMLEQARSCDHNKHTYIHTYKRDGRVFTYF